MENQAMRKVKDPGQRTASGLIVHLLWRLITIVLGIVLTLLLIGGVAGVLLSWKAEDYLKTDIIPNANFTLEGQKLNQTSFIYAYDKPSGQYTELQQIYALENRVWASYSEIPEYMVHATVAIEDKRFFTHDGVDWLRTLSACANMFVGGSSSYGGSTLTQQLIKNLTQDNEVTVRRKLNEIFRALEFEKHYSKEEILEWYLNTIYLGEGAYGVKSAAQTYFGKELSELTVKECACIIGITNNPSLYDPYYYPKNNEKRTLTILNEMRNQGYLDELTEAQYQAAKNQKLHFITESDEEKEVFTCTACSYEGTIDTYEKDGDYYTCPNCGEKMQFEVENEDYYTYFEDQVIRDVTSDLAKATGYSYDTANQMLLTGGYTIYSTIDLDVQAAVDSVYQHVSNIPETYSSQQLQSAIVVIDNETGDIIAIEGGVGQKTGSLTWNNATQSRRPTGSSIKPITVYGPALEMGIITPATAYDDSAYMLLNGREWPQNDSRTYSGYMLILDGLTKSLNSIAVKVLADLTPEKSYEFATEKMGMYNLVEAEEINGMQFTDIGLAPLALGQLTHGVTVREMATAFATFPNQGEFRKARTYTKVVDSNGKVILDNTQQTHTAMSAHAAWYVTYMLRNAVWNGTGWMASMQETSVAGKTGTSSDNCDRWFSGYTPRYTASVWCGYAYPEEIRLVKNRNPAAVLWKDVMTILHQDIPFEEFTMPEDEAFVGVKVCKQTGLLAGDDCESESVYLFRSDVPGKTCNNHVTFEIKFCYPGGIAEEDAKKYIATDYCQEYFDLLQGPEFTALTPEVQTQLLTAYKLNLLEDGKLVMLKVDEDGKIGDPDKPFTLEDALKAHNKENEDDTLEECTVHTAESVEALRKAIEEAAAVVPPTEPEPTDPTEPTEPTQPPTEPTEPTLYNGAVGSDAWLSAAYKPSGSCACQACADTSFGGQLSMLAQWLWRGIGNLI